MNVLPGAIRWHRSSSRLRGHLAAATGTPQFFAGVPPSPGTSVATALPGVASVSPAAVFAAALTQGRAGPATAVAVADLLGRRHRLSLSSPRCCSRLAELLITARRPGVRRHCRHRHPRRWPFPVAFASHFIFGPLFEETGWRGFALPRMQYRSGPLRGALLLDCCGEAGASSRPPGFRTADWRGVVGMAMFVAFTVAVSVIFTWVSNNLGQPVTGDAVARIDQRHRHLCSDAGRPGRDPR